jgi:acyl carrier protein
MTHYAVGAALEALGEDAGLIRSGGLQLGIVTCTLTGGISYSRRFYEEALQNPSTASPIIFPETVFNSCASHLAAYLGSSAVNYTLVGDAGTFLQGLALAAGWLDNGLAEACVVLGAEEPDWTVADALRLFDRRAVHASGAGALYLKSRPSSGAPVELAAVTDAFAPTRTPDRHEAARKMRAQLPVGAPEELLCACERGHPAWSDWTGKVVAPTEILGEAFAASRSLRGRQCEYHRRQRAVHCGALCQSSFSQKSRRHIAMNTPADLKNQIKSFLIEDLMLQITPQEIGDDQPLFGPGSLGLDSVDALQLVVALDKRYGLKIADAAVARKTMQTVTSIAAAIEAHQAGRK